MGAAAALALSLLAGLPAAVWPGLAAGQVVWEEPHYTLAPGKRHPQVPEIGSVFRDCAECPRMVVVPAGSFVMGSSGPQGERRGRRGRPHRVDLAHPFALGMHEVTFAEWDACVADGGCGQRRPPDEGWGRGDRPVIHVSWEDTQSYVRWLTEKTGREYRLPSESEWEYAARAGTDTSYHWGEEIGSNRANCRDCGSRWDGESTAPVGSFEANEFGLHDVHGNVWEWMADCWNRSNEGAPADGAVWTSGDCSRRVLRGGAWRAPPRLLKSSRRARARIAARKSAIIGFRVVRPLTPSPGSVFRDCRECPEMVVVPAGSFTMGSPASERARPANSGPAHRVEIARPFALGVHEVTFAEWDACVADGGCRGYRPPDEGWGRGDRPVIHVSWEDTQSYVRWLSRKTGRRYRLPSESEWEYAARAGTDTGYHWGGEVGRNRANCRHCGSRWDGERTAPVGSFEANGFGLHDVHGNVWEWVEDCWNRRYVGAPADGSAWKSGACDTRVLRGGAWRTPPALLRVERRIRTDVEKRRHTVIGFRIARALTPATVPVFRDCEECPEMVVVPAGGFLMGSPDSERGRYGNEGPVHPVEVARSFAMGAYEVTFAEWDACVAGGGCRGYRPPDEGWGRGSRPVVNVSWEDAQSYVQWLSEKTGREYRLPSEAEWEYAARAGTDTRYHWGDEIQLEKALANCDECGSRWDDERTAPVGSFRANAFGLYDVHGNAWEWVEDCWNASYVGAPADGSAWESGDCGLHVLRGGSWYNFRRNLRSAVRGRFRTGGRDDKAGFRVVQTLTSSPLYAR